MVYCSTKAFHPLDLCPFTFLKGSIIQLRNLNVFWKIISFNNEILFALPYFSNLILHNTKNNYFSIFIFMIAYYMIMSFF